MRAFDRHRQGFAELGGAAGMIEVAVGEQDLLGRHAVLLDGGLDTPESPPGSTTAPRLGRLQAHSSEQFCCERRDGNDGGFERHGSWSRAGVAALS